MSEQKKVVVPISVEYLDLIFDEIVKNTQHDGQRVTAASLIDYFNIKSIRFSETQMISILDKLKKDEVIVAKINDVPLKVISRDTEVQVTFEGILFRQTKVSYRQKYLQDVAENNRVKNLEISQREQAETLNTLTGGILIATVVAALYYLIEVSKWIYSAFHKH